MIELRDPEQEDQLIYQVNDEPRPRESEVLTTESAVDSELIGTAVFDATGEKSSMPSWDELVRQHGDRVYRLAYRLSGDAQDAEDLTQDTFIRVFRSLSDYQPGTLEGWLHRITTNLFLDMVRRRNRIRMEALPEDYDRVPHPARTPSRSTTTRASTQVCRPRSTHSHLNFALLLCSVTSKVCHTRKSVPHWE
ncbi:hypothetical protein GCM10020255_096320 [Rhodococcus baikonurensis]